MKKEISISLIVVGLVFAVFSNAFASENKGNYVVDQKVTDSVVEGYKTNAYENKESYKNDQIITVTDTLDDLYYRLVYKNGKVIATPEDNPYDTTAKKDKTVVVYYQELSEIKEVYNYAEDHGGYQYTGSLKLTEVIASGNGYEATFSGEISESVE